MSKPEDRLRSPESELRFVADNAPVLLAHCDREHRYVFVNRAYTERFGLEPRDIVGKRMPEVVGKEAYETLRPHIDRALAGERVEFELAIPYSQLGRRFMHVVYVPDRDQNGKVHGLLAAITDVTNRQRAEQALAEAQRQIQAHAAQLEKLVEERTARLQESMTELESFSYSVSHDMRAPLRAMQSFAKILVEEHGDKLGEDGNEYLKRIMTAANRMDKLILDVLHYSRVTRSDWTLVPVDAEKLIRGVIESQPAFQPPNAQITIEGPFPTVLANEAALTQCASNLLSNAVKFVQPGEFPHVNISAERRDDFVRIFFQDNGIGIDPEFHERIFGMFQRLSTKYEGTGLGLSIVRKAAERMGGKVGLDSKAGQGSTFWLQLKAA